MNCILVELFKSITVNEFDIKVIYRPNNVMSVHAFDSFLSYLWKINVTTINLSDFATIIILGSCK